MFDAFSALRNDSDSLVFVLTSDHLGLIKPFVETPSAPPRGAEDPYRKLLSELSKNKLYTTLQTVTLAELTGMKSDALAKLMQDIRRTDEHELDVYNQTEVHKHIRREELSIAITIAAYLGREDLLELLIFAFETARPYQQDKTQWKAFGLAAYVGHAKCIDMLFNFHITLLAKQHRYHSDVHDLILSMSLFLKDGIEGTIYYDRSDTFQVISQLFNSLSNGDAFKYINISPLLEKAITLQRFNVAIKLLPAYAAMIQRERKYDDFIKFYLSCESIFIRRSLISAIREVVISDKSGLTLLHYLCINHRNKKGFDNLLIDLLKMGARLDITDKDGATPLECLPPNVMVKILRNIPETLRVSVPLHLLQYCENDTEAFPASVAPEEAASAASSAEAPTVPSTPAVTSSIAAASAAAAAASPAVSASSAAASPAPVGGWFYSVLGTVRYLSDRLDGKNTNEANAPRRDLGHK